MNLLAKRDNKAIEPTVEMLFVRVRSYLWRLISIVRQTDIQLLSLCAPATNSSSR
jgi:hypothetical protein